MLAPDRSARRRTPPAGFVPLLCPCAPEPGRTLLFYRPGVVGPDSAGLPAVEIMCRCKRMHRLLGVTDIAPAPGMPEALEAPTERRPAALRES